MLPPSAPALDTYAAWVAEAITREVYLGWLAEQEGVILAGVGLPLLEWGPTHDDPIPGERGWSTSSPNSRTAARASPAS